MCVTEEGPMQEFTVALSADDNYARPLAVAAKSVVSKLSDERRVQIVVLDMGISKANRELVETSLADPRASVLWIDSLQDRVGDLPNTWTTITRATYARLYIPEVLPTSVDRVVYLDCDVIARRDVGDLVFSEMADRVALAVPDVQSFYVSSLYAYPYWHRDGRSPSDLNFNAGVMLIDLNRWRSLNATAETLRYLTDGRHHFAQDQEAINVVLGDLIGELDPRWNQQSEIFIKAHEVTYPMTTTSWQSSARTRGSRTIRIGSSLGTMVFSTRS
jgi:lipopolysaccharide biosynthesis glycosyltransferase